MNRPSISLPFSKRQPKMSLEDFGRDVAQHIQGRQNDLQSRSDGSDAEPPANLNNPTNSGFSLEDFKREVMNTQGPVYEGRSAGAKEPVVIEANVGLLEEGALEETEDDSPNGNTIGTLPIGNSVDNWTSEIRVKKEPGLKDLATTTKSGFVIAYRSQNGKLTAYSRGKQSKTAGTSYEANHKSLAACNCTVELSSIQIQFRFHVGLRCVEVDGADVPATELVVEDDVGLAKGRARVQWRQPLRSGCGRYCEDSGDGKEGVGYFEAQRGGKPARMLKYGNSDFVLMFYTASARDLLTSTTDANFVSRSPGSDESLASNVTAQGQSEQGNTRKIFYSLCATLDGLQAHFFIGMLHMHGKNMRLGIRIREKGVRNAVD
ncbi:hypothetical protein B0H14DRAFT_3549358 [Mycena olivaceomarginata]|nr:hypothetical protein B0H14DRAFT_3549358 [Mycena olivaceomarginata]